MPKSNREIINEVHDLINQGRVREAFETYVVEDYIQHNPTCANGREDAIKLIEGFVAAPGFRSSVERTVVDGDFIAQHLHLILGDDGPELAIMDLWRFENGKIVEHWDVTQEVPATTVSGNSMF